MGLDGDCVSVTIGQRINGHGTRGSVADLLLRRREILGRDDVLGDRTPEGWWGVEAHLNGAVAGQHVDVRRSTRQIGCNRVSRRGRRWASSLRVHCTYGDPVGITGHKTIKTKVTRRTPRRRAQRSAARISVSGRHHVVTHRRAAVGGGSLPAHRERALRCTG